VTRPIAITGANGFIGRHVVEHLQQHGKEVRCLVREGADITALGEAFDIRRIDLSLDSLVEALKGCGSLIHLAGRRTLRSDLPGELSPFTTSGVPMMDALFRASSENGLSLIVQASSIATYSTRNTRPYVETEQPASLNPYGLSKVIAEQHAALWTATSGIPVTSLRIAACYGHGEREEAALMRFVGQARRNETMRVAEGGRYEIDQIYVKDVAAAFHAALEVGREGPVNIGAGRGYSVLDIAQTAHKVFGNDHPIEMEGKDPGVSPNPKSYMRIDRAKEWLSWEPKYTLEQAFTEMKNI